MNYKTPMQNQNKGYESRDLKDMPIISRATVGSSISKHMTTPKHMMGSLKGKGSPNMKTDTIKKEEQNYARNAIASGKAGDASASKYDKMKLAELSAGEGRKS